ncbi:GrpE-domain-containing protein [Corynascus novoguineensis]|uniref:GrpE protein homolog n=1 Tax=Corynascus novoguineensis TaxID=1126955 RepID=A0AAN7D226_9PEZI|nr:GrpE-domain-containing protein [Corynascus novoguineensis]
MLRQTISATSRTLRSTARLGTQRQAFALFKSYQTPLATARVVAPRTRWYSSETDAAKNNGDEAKEQAEAESPEAALKKQLEAKDAEIRDLKDRYLRSVADFRNLQDRTQRDMKAARDFAIQNFARDLVESVDNFDRALGVVPGEKLKPENKTEHTQDLINLYDGLKMTENVLLQTLKKHGLERFEPDGEVFNPNEHEATFMTPMPDKEHNTVFHVQQKGFKLNGRVLRPAKVGVVKNK